MEEIKLLYEGKLPKMSEEEAIARRIFLVLRKFIDSGTYGNCGVIKMANDTTNPESALVIEVVKKYFSYWKYGIVDFGKEAIVYLLVTPPTQA